ncbi:MAG: hypothetical protein HY820_13220 [Acidobacteria bacterium]|nr:hypothetical protein [Acidobacteriota bacterium]
MTRSQLEHIIRAAGVIADDNDVIIIGSQAVLGQFPEAPPELLASIEADIYPRTFPQRSEMIDVAIGEGSKFEVTFGYYAHGIGPETAILPEGWESRLIPIDNENTRHIRGWCLEVHDLAISKHVAGREKDLHFNAALVRHGMVQRGMLLHRLAATTIAPELRAIVTTRIEAMYAST